MGSEDNSFVEKSNNNKMMNFPPPVVSLEQTLSEMKEFRSRERLCKTKIKIKNNMVNEEIDSELEEEEILNDLKCHEINDLHISICLKNESNIEIKIMSISSN